MCTAAASGEEMSFVFVSCGFFASGHICVIVFDCVSLGVFVCELEICIFCLSPQ